jgi:hypothetical protein
MRSIAVVSGGLIPDSLHNTKNDMTTHIVDWYPTFCGLAGVDPADGSFVQPLSVNADVWDDIYSNVGRYALSVCALRSPCPRFQSCVIFFFLPVRECMHGGRLLE